MRIAGIVLLIVGILMMIFTGFNVTREKEIVDLGPLEINKQEEKRIGWPAYAGGIVAVLGLVLVIAGRNKKG
ncbi:MAG TPA: hypothetical protein VEB40_03680 [Flavipsychrobacter sp.]|nr:hypothetical protein [Flavipsychrobacter sp.]